MIIVNSHVCNNCIIILTHCSSTGESTSEVLKVAIQARSRALGPFHPTFDVNKIITDALEKVLPEDCHKRVNGRLHISVTRVSDSKNVILSQFDSKEDLIQAVLCSCFIPFWSGIFPPKFHGVSYIDGGLSDNLLVLDANTVTVSPFAGESDICPMDTSFHPVLQVSVLNTSFAMTPHNIYRLYGLLFPPPPEVMSKTCQQGFDDALRFLQRNNKISCLRCVAIQSSFTVAETDKITAVEEEKKPRVLPKQGRISIGGQQSVHRKVSLGSNAINKTPSRASIKIVSRSSSIADFDGMDSEFEVEFEHEFDGCEDCERRRETAILDSLPEPVARAIQETCDDVNKGVINWLFKHRPVKLLSLLTLPYVLPFDITIVVLTKLYRKLPWMKAEAKKSLSNLSYFVKNQLMKSGAHMYSAQFSCQLSVTEFAYNQDEADAVIVSEAPSPIKTGNSSPAKLRKNSIIKGSDGDQENKADRRTSHRRIAKLERSNTFGGRRKIGIDHSRVGHPNFGQQPQFQSLQRKSYAGSEQSLAQSSSRRISAAATPFSCQPERVLSTVNFGFTVDLASNSMMNRCPSSRSSSKNLLIQTDDDDDFDSVFGVTSDKKSFKSNCPPDVIETLKNLSEEVPEVSHASSSSNDGIAKPVGKQEISALNLANRALHWERETMAEQCEQSTASKRRMSFAEKRTSSVRKISTNIPPVDSSDGFDRILAATSSQDHPLMSFYYMDENNQVKMTEIFNIPPADSTEISQEELQSRW